MIKRILFFYIDGFKNLSDLGRKLWVLIIIKLVVIFVVLKVFLFPTLNSKIHNSQELQNLYLQQLTKITTTNHKKEE
jgi:hypothetical protein